MHLQQEELDAKLALLLGRKEEGASNHNRGREHSLGDQSRAQRSVGSRQLGSRHHNRLGERGRCRSRSQESNMRGGGRSEKKRREASPDRRSRGSRQTPPRKSETEELARRLAEVEQKLTISNPTNKVPDDSTSPFSPEIDCERADPNKNAPYMEAYDGSGYPIGHNQVYDRLMRYYDYSDAAKCQIFIMTLTKDARQWMTSLAPNSISVWKELSDKFHTRFGSNKRSGKPTGSLDKVVLE